MRRRSLTSGLILSAASVLALFLAPAASAHFPSPHCGWAKPALLDRTFGVSVAAPKAVWHVNIAPVLRCSYKETTPHFQAAGAPILTIEYREIQRLKLNPALVPVNGLGSCRVRVSCPVGQTKAAWIYVANTAISGSLTGAFTSGVALGVEDGLNLLNIELVNPGGPLPVANEQAAVIRLARKLLPRFRYK